MSGSGGDRSSSNAKMRNAPLPKAVLSRRFLFIPLNLGPNALSLFLPEEPRLLRNTWKVETLRRCKDSPTSLVRSRSVLMQVRTNTNLGIGALDTKSSVDEYEVTALPQS